MKFFNEEEKIIGKAQPTTFVEKFLQVSHNSFTFIYMTLLTCFRDLYSCMLGLVYTYWPNKIFLNKNSRNKKPTRMESNFLL